MIRYINRSSNSHAYGAYLSEDKTSLVAKCLVPGLACITLVACLGIMSSSSDNWFFDLALQARDFSGNVRVEKTKPIQ
jgi:hypothetical protein